jgi:hypothetical protein
MANGAGRPNTGKTKADLAAAEPALPDKPSIEDIITALLRFKSLFVVARNSSFAGSVSARAAISATAFFPRFSHATAGDRQQW